MPSDSNDGGSDMSDLLLGALLTGAAALSVAVLTGQTSTKGIKKNVSSVVKSAKQIPAGGMGMAPGPAPDPSPRQDPAPKPKKKRDRMSKDMSSNRATAGSGPLDNAGGGGGAGTGSTAETSFGPAPESFVENRAGGSSGGDGGGGTTADQTTFGEPKSILETRGSLQGPAGETVDVTTDDSETDSDTLKPLSDISDDPVTTTAAGDPLSDRDFAIAARKAAKEEGNLGLN